MKSARTFDKLLGIKSPWRVREVVLRMDEPHPGRRGPVVGGAVEIHVEHHGPTRCPECGSVHRHGRNRHHADPPAALADARTPFEFHRGPRRPTVEAPTRATLRSHARQP